MENKTSIDTARGGGTFALLAEYSSPEALVSACKQVRDAGYQKWDAYSPFPVHGIDPAMGIRATRLPWFVFFAGLAGLGAAVLMQWWMNSVDYPWNISGKPLFSLPANIPVMFEVTVLFSALTTFFGCLVLNKLPEHHHPLFKKQRFAKVSDDKFFIAIEAADPQFDAVKTRQLLAATHAAAVEDVEDDRQVGAAFPRPLIYGAIVAVAVTLVPIAFIAKARVSKSEKTRVHLAWDMDNQAKYKPQQSSPLFPDKRSTRPQVEGTVAVGEAALDDHFYRGRVDGEWATDFPSQIDINEQTMARGQERFDIYCAVCHGTAGAGDGMVARRADQLAEGTWVPPTSVHADHVRTQPVGQLFNSISNGIRNMPGYGHLIPEHDRWAITLYMKALQRSHLANLEDVPAEQRAGLQ